MEQQQAMPEEDPMATPEAQAVMQNLIEAGYPPELAQGAYQLELQGMQPEQIDEWINQQMMGVQNG